MYISKLLYFFLLFCLACQAQKNIEISQTTIISNAEFPTVEPHLAINPINNKDMAVGAMEFSGKNEGSKMAVYYSVNSGRSWFKSRQIANENIKGADPYLSYDSDGKLHFTYISNSNAYLRVSNDNGLTWSKPKPWPKNGGGSYDYVKMAISLTENKYKNNIYLWAAQNYDFSENSVSSGSFLTVYNDNNTIEYKKKILPGNLSYQVGSLGIFYNGTVLSTFHEIDVNGGYIEHPRLWIIKTADAGGSFSTPILVHQNFLADSPDLTIDNSQKSIYRDQCYLSWLELEKREEGVSFWNNYVSLSKDIGNVWSTPLKINDTILKGQHPSHHPRIAVNYKGIIILTWKDPRNAELDENGCFDLYMAYSINGGKSFSKNIRLTNVTTCANTQKNRIEYDEKRDVIRRYRDGGDYHGLSALNDGSFQVVWSDSTNGVFQLQTLNILFE